MGFKIFLCSSTYPEREETINRIGIDVSDSIDGFVKAIGRNEILPFLGAYQRMTYSYFFFKKLIKEYKLDFVLVTGGSTIIPSTIAEKTLVYVHFPVDIEVASERYQKSKMKKIYIKPWLFISNNLDDIKRATIITNSNYTKNAIREAWGIDSKVIYPPCPQYSFALSEQEKRENVVCSLGRFTPEKDHEMIVRVAQNLPSTRFELVGSVTQDKAAYLKKLIDIAPKNMTFHVNATVQEKIDVLKKSRVLLHTFVGEHFGIALVEAMSAGAIPVTHNSGAAKDDGLVDKKFRYNDIEDAVTCVSRALVFWNLDEAKKLREFAKQFSPESFRENIKAFISKWIKSM
jgi:glycosyltransferase involved in cell wall biosynthesis